MRVAAIQFDIAWQDKPANHATIERLIEAEKPDPGTFILLPELGDTGFSFDLDAIVDDRSLEWARSAARRLQVWIQAGFAERGTDGRGRNCATLVSPAGEVMGTYRKVHPFGYSKEVDHYSGGDEIVIRRCDDAEVCPLICYDLRFPELWRIAAVAGAEVFTIGASWPDARQTHWRSLLIARAIENQAYVIAANRTGRDPHLSYAGGSIIIGPRGDVLAEAGDQPAVLSAEIDIPALRAWRDEFPALRDARPALLGSMKIDRSIRQQEARPAAG